MENQNLPATKCGQNSLTENKGKSLSNWIVSASKMKKVSGCTETEIRKMIAYVMIMVGFKDKPEEAEALVLIDFIQSRLSRFSIEEFKVAYTLFVEGKLDIDREHYNSFSTIYLGRVMESYSRYRFSHLKNHEKAIEEEQDEPKALTNDDIENLIIESFERFLTKKDIYDFGAVQYRYLERLGLIDLTREQEMEIMVQAKQAHMLMNMSAAGRIINSENSEAVIVDIARMISLRNYFNQLKKHGQHIAVILNDIKKDIL